MEKHSTLHSRVISLILLFITSTLLFYGCKRENNFNNQPDMSIEKAKGWFEKNYSGSVNSSGYLSQNQQSVESSIVQNRSKTSGIAKLLLWNSYHSIVIDGIYYLAVDISNGSIKFANGQHGTRFAVFSNSSDAKVNLNIIEILSNDPITKVNSLQLTENVIRTMKGIIAIHKIQQAFNVIIYNENYKYVESFENKKGNLRSKKIKISKRSSQSAIQSSTEQSSTNENCELWGMFMITYNEDGSIKEAELLYTFYVGDCDTINNPNNQDDPGDYGGGEDEDESDEINMFYQYVAMEIRPAVVEGSSSEPNGDPISDIVTWSVAKATYAGWQILADTRYSYTHDTYFDVLNMSVNHVFTFLQWSTTGSYFVGSQVAIESTWTQTSSVDQVLNNGTSQAVGKAKVIGNIKHRLRHPLPLSGSLETVQYIPGNELRFKPN
jgi:hypothetical protein